MEAGSFEMVQFVQEFPYAFVQSGILRADLRVTVGPLARVAFGPVLHFQEMVARAVRVVFQPPARRVWPSPTRKILRCRRPGCRRRSIAAPWMREKRRARSPRQSALAGPYRSGF